MLDLKQMLGLWQGRHMKYNQVVWVAIHLSSLSFMITYIVTMAQQRKRCSYDLSFKPNAVESEEKILKEAAVHQFGVIARRIREWRGR